jgi:peptidoglycan lytic transglycosylase
MLLLPARAPHAQQLNASAATDIVLKPTNHPLLPADISLLWLAPTPRTPRTPEMTAVLSAVKLELDSSFPRALSLLSEASVSQGTLGGYALYYKGVAELRLERTADARRTFRALRATQPVGYLAEAAALREAECDEALGDNRAAMEIYEKLSKGKAIAADDILIRLGHSSRVTGNLEKAVEAFSRVVYEFPFSELVPQALSELDSLPVPSIDPGTNRYKLELGRGERLFGAKRYTQARQVFDGLKNIAQDDDRELVNLRIAECEYYLKRPRNARDGVRPYIDGASRQGEALFFYAVAVRELGDVDEYLRTVRRLTQEFSDQSWAEEALNNLATHYILQNEDAQADATFREMYENFPMGHYAERAAWKIGWWSYKNGRYADAIRAFESGAAHFPRSDYRPSWLYWSARAHDVLNEPVLAQARYALVASDYLNTYYGRLALTHLDGGSPQRQLVADTPSDLQARGADGNPIPHAALPPNASIVRSLLALELYDQAVDELRYAQRVWGDSSVIQATFGWIENQRGDLRAGINAMKRAYPQYMAAGGEQLPPELLKVLFPVNYWTLIRQYSNERQLDPYMIAALIAQESTFTADVRSSANAYGLMQILPSTGRQYARSLRMPSRFSVGMLKTAETNIKMGTAYFSDLVRQFGGVHYALATYNAGPNRVARWISERPGVSREEFIDDIPFPETQNYVKKILGTAEDYRRLYGSDSSAGTTATTKPAVPRAAAPQKSGAAAQKSSAAAKKPPAKAPAKKKAAPKKKKAA